MECDPGIVVNLAWKRPMDGDRAALWMQGGWQLSAVECVGYQEVDGCDKVRNTKQMPRVRGLVMAVA